MSKIDERKNQQLSKEIWNDAAERIQMTALAVADWLRKRNYQGQGEQDAEQFLTEMQLAYMAMKYVAKFAADKCRFIVTKDSEARP